MQELTSDTYDEFIKSSDIPVLVDFWAPWCGPCKAISPILEELSADFVGIVKFAKLNVDDSPEIAQAHEVRSIPALLLFSGGQFVGRVDTAGGFNKRKLFIKIVNALSLPIEIDQSILDGESIRES